VSCIYTENALLQSKMSKSPILENLGPLAKAGIPILHLCGELDPYLKDQSRMAETRYRELGGSFTVSIVPNATHYPLSPSDPTEALNFITALAL